MMVKRESGRWLYGCCVLSCWVVVVGGVREKMMRKKEVAVGFCCMWGCKVARVECSVWCEEGDGVSAAQGTCFIGEGGLWAA